MKSIWISLFAAAGLWHGQATATTTMRVATWLSPTSEMNTTVLPTWGKWIEEATEGRVTLKLEHDLGAPQSMIDLVQDGAVDASWTYHGYFPGRFKLTTIAELPNLGAGAEAASVAHWKIHEKYLAKAHEHGEVVVAGLFTHGPGEIHMREPINSLNELAGKKIRIGGGVQNAIGETLNITGVAAPTTKVYEMLTQGVVDGVFNPMNTKRSMRFKEVAPYTLKMPHGLYLGSFGIFIGEDFFDRISNEDREAIMAVSGEKLSAMAARAWVKADREAEQDALEYGNTITPASEQDVQRFTELTRNIEQNWLKDVAERKVDAPRALQEFRRIARDYQAQLDSQG
ncbi:TRAP-type C4-dicarboxylate transport system substrate-binding protein [Oceanisphaera litoralis]|uniref:TRAP transporter substrate-binding protein n=1 Tax=Oceanisphaera litoralis TaxID=225144 RepID=UPI00195A4727|nr:TRAP transporter substrate-binding protein [Oceanisphaera litoralis]MBM7454188.1 TRAP-type C4-dicarboxylate transport system substrate-binding protein [Oceanisphaera litoralis]